MTEITKSIDVRCPRCDSCNFEIRVLKDAGIGTARCVNCDADYLMLDSGDYWFDAIQRRYPPLSRCSCNGTPYRLTFGYDFRDDGDIKAVRVWSACSSCGKKTRRLTVDID